MFRNDVRISETLVVAGKGEISSTGQAAIVRSLFDFDKTDTICRWNVTETLGHRGRSIFER